MKKPLKACCKRCGKCCLGPLKTLIRFLPPIPDCISDRFVSYRVGNKAPEHPQVLFFDSAGCLQLLPPCELPAQASDTLRFVIVSDTHERHRALSLPQGDIFLHSGDICMSSSLWTQRRGRRILKDFNDWLQTVPCKEKVIIGGNHDTALKEAADTGDVAKLLSAAVWLQDSSVTLPLSGVKIYGHAYSHGHSHNDAWQSVRGKAPSITKSACAGADVVLTHLCDETVRSEVLSHAQPRLWASGHEHKSHGVSQQDGIIYVNAAIQDARYDPSQAPVVVDLPTKRALIQSV